MDVGLQDDSALKSGGEGEVDMDGEGNEIKEKWMQRKVMKGRWMVPGYYYLLA